MRSSQTAMARRSMSSKFVGAIRHSTLPSSSQDNVSTSLMSSVRRLVSETMISRLDWTCSTARWVCGCEESSCGKTALCSRF